jgi:mannose-6-phosphate isomerase
MGELRDSTRALRDWIVEAYDLWWRNGADHVRGGFHERLRHDGSPTHEPRRARLHPRQAFAYSYAPRLGWSGPYGEAVEHALTYFMTRYQREDGFFRALISADGEILDDDVVLYDQAFALLGLAAGHAALGRTHWREAALALLDALRTRLAHPAIGFYESTDRATPLLSNSHMHLLEASLAWTELDQDPRWVALASEIAELALTRLIDPHSGALPEWFEDDWQPAADSHIEPGHQFEWAWLLHRFGAHSGDMRSLGAARRLIEIGELHGVAGPACAAIAALGPDLAVRDATARLWAQCERVKAACSAFALTGAAEHHAIALKAATLLQTYLHTPVRGLWRDRLDARGRFLDEPAPASSLYHLAGAVLALSAVTETQ